MLLFLRINTFIGKAHMEAELEDRGNQSSCIIPTCPDLLPWSLSKGKINGHRKCRSLGSEAGICPLQCLLIERWMDPMNSSLSWEEIRGPQTKTKPYFDSMNICHSCPTPAVPAVSQETSGSVSWSPKISPKRSLNRELWKDRKPKTLSHSVLSLLFPLVCIFLPSLPSPRFANIDCVQGQWYRV